MLLSFLDSDIRNTLYIVQVNDNLTVMHVYIGCYNILVANSASLYGGVLAGEVEVVEEGSEHALGLRYQQVCISLAWSSCCPLVQLLC